MIFNANIYVFTTLIKFAHRDHHRVGFRHNDIYFADLIGFLHDDITVLQQIMKWVVALRLFTKLIAFTSVNNGRRPSYIGFACRTKRSQLESDFKILSKR